MTKIVKPTTERKLVTLTDAQKGTAKLWSTVYKGSSKGKIFDASLPKKFTLQDVLEAVPSLKPFNARRLLRTLQQDGLLFVVDILDHNTYVYSWNPTL